MRGVTPGRALRAATPALLAIALAVAMSWPLTLHLGGSVGGDLGDPLFFTWQVAWMGHAALHQPLDFFQANIYWPLQDSLAFTDTLMGFAPAAVFAGPGKSAVLTYNLLFLFAYALAFLGAYLLARELGTGPLGGLCAGAAFAYAPWRLAHNQHLPLVSSGGIPLALFLLLRGYRRHDARFVFAGWLVAAWQMTLGFALGLQFAYLLAVLAAIAVPLAWHRRRLFLTRGLAVATAAGVCALALATFVHARPYLRVVEDHPESERTAAYVASLSPTPKGFLAAPSQSLVWGDATASARTSFEAPVEQTLFPGLTISLLALVGLLAPVYSGRLRLGLAAGTAVCAALSVGISDAAGRRRYLEPYRLLYELAPGWDAVRTPGRINLLTSLGLALLAAAGIVFVAGYVKRVVGRTPLAAAAAAALLAAILVEGLGPLRVQAVPPPPAGQKAFGSPRLHLPPDVSGAVVRYIYWSTDGFEPLVNGLGSFAPASNARLLEAIGDFPDPASVERLRRIGVRTVVLHRDLAKGTSWEAVPRRPLGRLPVTREVDGEVVIYRLASH
jgi:hypothetical protein